MNPPYEFVIAGAGLAGAAAALHLSRDYSVLVLDAGMAAGGASGAGAGLINPMLGRRARASWRIDEALAAVEETIDLAGADDLYDDRGVLRPAAREDQIGYFKEAAESRPDLAVWLSAAKVAEEYPDVHAPHGALRVVRGGAIDIRRFVEQMLRTAEGQGAKVSLSTKLINWQEVDGKLRVAMERDGDQIEARCNRLMLAVGDGFRRFKALNRLGLHRVKGQTIRVRRPDSVDRKCAIPPISGSGYIVPEIATWVLGSTYEHGFESVEPSIEADAEILRKTSLMMPQLAAAEVLERRAGVRVTVPRRRLPMVGPVDGEHVWTIAGLGSKGLLVAPLIAKNLAGWMETPAAIPSELRPLPRE
jgi:glycine/D-amino acid oxidase-like deaminating enzyme